VLLHINAAPRPRGQSRSLRVADAFIEGFLESNPGADIQTMDLFDIDLGMVDAIDANTRLHQSRGADLEGEEKKRMDRFCQSIEPLLHCRHLLVTTPMWNFGPPWKLKQWLDTVMQARITFRYTENGPEGLVNAKGAIVGSRGGVYPEGDPRETHDFLTPYLKMALRMMGVEVTQVCFAEAIDKDPAKTDQVLADAEERARAAGRAF
jgi:FMN-dependent NADH-azoreductase